MLLAKVVAPDTIDDIAIRNGGVRPPNETLNDNTIFVYSDEVPTFHEILTREQFDQDYRWIDPSPGRNTNEIRPRNV